MVLFFAFSFHSTAEDIRSAFHETRSNLIKKTYTNRKKHRNFKNNEIYADNENAKRRIGARISKFKTNSQTNKTRDRNRSEKYKFEISERAKGRRHSNL